VELGVFVEPGEAVVAGGEPAGLSGGVSGAAEGFAAAGGVGDPVLGAWAVSVDF